MTKSVTDVLNDLRATASKNLKERIIQDNSDHDGLREAFRVAYSKELNFFVRNFKVELKVKGMMPLSKSIEMLVENIASRHYTGDDAKLFMTQLVQTCEEPETLLAIINRDLECGVQTTITNKVWKDLITEPPYQSYTLFTEKLLRKFNFKGAFSDEKMDGLYADIMVWPDQVVFRSRSGKELNFRAPVAVEEALMAAACTRGPFVAHGEGLVIDETYPHGVQPREIGNGYLNQDPSEIDRDRVQLVVWDMVDMDDYIARSSKVEYYIRRDNTSFLVTEVNVPTHFQMVRGRKINSLREAIEHFIEMRKQKKEGTVLKSADMLWGDNKTKKGIKLKNEFDVDLEVIDTTVHKKKDGWVGALICQTRDGLLEVGVGSGLTDALRKMTADYFVGQIITIKANDITKSETKELQSLFLPRLNYKFVEIRRDKSVANSLDEVIEAADSLLELLLKIAEDVDK